MPRALTLALAAACIFAVVAAAMLRLMPRPLKDSDYMVIGSVATLIALLGLFVAMLATSRPSDVFFKKRKKP
ncbi:MAG TPA: hypothetical protein VKX39_12370 [Bryobacteraceae bacterium]|jgi:ABC-type Fe3+-siderophore transport system permease subunit|nr:hypothetical protein [Bryobacteraceae bacterium]